jgi:hypothetical protein
MTGLLRPTRTIAICVATALYVMNANAQTQSAPANSQTTTLRPQPPIVSIPRATQPPKLEDYLNGTAQPFGLKITDFRQRDPGDGIPVSEPTTAYLSYDDENFYVVFVCKDEPGGARGHLSKREAVGGDDIVGILLDTFHDRQRAYEFFVNPLGIQMDGIATEGQNDDFSFDTLWHSEGRMTDDGYVTWMSIPFKSMRFTTAPSQTWGIALLRAISRKNETSFWPYITHQIQGFAQQMATLEGLERISPGRNIQLIPYGFVSHSQFLDQQIPAFRTNTDVRAGLDAKFVIKDALTLDLTVNPDFSQVESDEPQVTLNQRFEVFFPEKRPFFLENAGIFRTPENLFFSRRIADPQFGARLTGKIGGWVLGALAMDDRAPGNLVPESDPLHGDRAAVGVLRIQREFSNQSSAGVLITSRDLGPISNRVFSFDTRLKLSEHWVATGQAIASLTRDIGRRRFNGADYFGELNYSDRHFNYDAQYTDRSPTFRSDLGFINRVDIRQAQQFARYQWIPKKGAIQSFGPSVGTLINYDRLGRLQDWNAVAEFNLALSNTTQFSVSREESFTLFHDRGFRQHSTEFGINTSMWNWLSASAGYSAGTGVNFFPAARIDPFLGKIAGANLSFTVKPTSQLSLEQTYIYSRLGTLEPARAVLVPPSVSVFNNHLMRSKVNYQFTRELSLRAIFDYDAVLSNESLIAADRSKRFNADFLLTYYLHPGTAFYVGYSSGLENLSIASIVPPTLLRTASPTTVTGRQFFVKVSYLFRF